MPARWSYPGCEQGADSETAQGVSVSSRVQFLKLLRNPWTVARSASPVARRTFVSVMSDMGDPSLRGEGNTRSDSSRKAVASSSTSMACLLRGTRCSTPAFIR